ncbi:MAG: C4-type zinc ribbon domain-containing protein [Acidobacteriota bacterium]
MVEDKIDLKSLIELQAIDIDLKNIEKELNIIPVLLSEIDKSVEEERQKVSFIEAKMDENQKRRKELESQTIAIKNEIVNLKTQQHKKKLTNEQYLALKEDIELNQEKIEEIEDLILEEMLLADEIEKEIRESEKVLSQVEKKAKEEKTKIERKKTDLEKKQKEIVIIREGVLSKISSQYLNLYLRIAKKRDGIVLSPVYDEFCSVCHMRIRPQVINELKKSISVITCENCDRILYWNSPPYQKMFEKD